MTNPNTTQATNGEELSLEQLGQCSGGSNSSSPNRSDCTLNDGDYGKWY